MLFYQVPSREGSLGHSTQEVQGSAQEEPQKRSPRAGATGGQGGLRTVPYLQASPGLTETQGRSPEAVGHVQAGSGWPSIGLEQALASGSRDPRAPRNEPWQLEPPSRMVAHLVPKTCNSLPSSVLPLPMRSQVLRNQKGVDQLVAETSPCSL